MAGILEFGLTALNSGLNWSSEVWQQQQGHETTVTTLHADSECLAANHERHHMLVEQFYAHACRECRALNLCMGAVSKQNCAAYRPRPLLPQPLTIEDVDGVCLKWQAQLLQGDANLLAIGGIKAVQLDGLGHGGLLTCRCLDGCEQHALM